LSETGVFADSSMFSSPDVSVLGTQNTQPRFGGQDGSSTDN
jgi:hypothetical protein